MRLTKDFITKHNKKDVVVHGKDYEIYKVNDYFMVHIYGGPFAAVNTLEYALEWVKDFN